MQRGGNKPDRKRVVITSATTLLLLALPYAAIPEKLFFLVPAAVEVLALIMVLIWAGQRASNTNKKKASASENLRRSIDADIEKIKLDIERAPTATITKLLYKSLAALYKERDEESAVHRKAIREDIKRYGNHVKILQAERESIQADLVQKVGEEVEKAAEFFDKPKTTE